MPTVINFEDLSATVTPPFVARPGALTEQKGIKRGVPPVDVITSRFDIVNNTGQQTKPSELGFGQRSLDPFFDQQNAIPFTLDLGTDESEREFLLANTISITMGDYGEDTDNLSIQLFDDEWRLLGANSGTLAGGGTSFTSASLTANSTEGKRVRYVRFIGGSAERPNSVFYDNIVLTYTPTEDDLNENPIWGRNVGLAVANAIIDDALNRQADYVIENLIEKYSREGKAIRAAAEAFRNAIGGAASDVYNATFEQYLEALKKAAKFYGALTGRTGLQIASVAYDTVTKANIIAQQTGESPLSLDVLKKAGAEAIGDKIYPGVGGKTLQNLVEQGSISPRSSAETARSNNSIQNNASSAAKISVNNNVPSVVLSRKKSGSPRNDRISGTFKDDRLLGNAGNDILIGNQGWDGLIGDIGNDRLVGGDGSDMLNGCGKRFVAGEVDRLTGGTGVDLFVLGDPKRIYYDDRNRRTSGIKDYAVITDFNPNQDFIVLKGKFSNYIFKRNKIFLNNDGVKGFSRNDELIAQVKGSVNLSPVDIIFV
jgi:Ca2+-binding RTX toxin-like protein